MDLQNVINLLEEVGQEEIVSKLKKVSEKEQKEFVSQINDRKSYDPSDDDKECTFSPRINHYYRPYYK